MVRTAVMRVRSGNYRAAPYLNSFESYLLHLAGVVPSCCSLVSKFCVIPLFVISLC